MPAAAVHQALEVGKLFVVPQFVEGVREQIGGSRLRHAKQDEMCTDGSVSREISILAT